MERRDGVMTDVGRVGQGLEFIALLFEEFDDRGQCIGRRFFPERVVH